VGDDPTERGQFDPDTLIQKMEEAGRLCSSMMLRLYGVGRDKEDGREPFGNGGSLLTVDPGGLPGSIMTKTVRGKAEREEAAMICTEARSYNLGTRTPQCEESPLRRGVAPPSIEALRRRLDFAMEESTKSFKSPLEDRYYAMTTSLKVISDSSLRAERLRSSVRGWCSRDRLDRRADPGSEARSSNDLGASP
jgi:hypothetical protein